MLTKEQKAAVDEFLGKTEMRMEQYGYLLGKPVWVVKKKNDKVEKRFMRAPSKPQLYINVFETLTEANVIVKVEEEVGMKKGMSYKGGKIVSVVGTTVTYVMPDGVMQTDYVSREDQSAPKKKLTPKEVQARDAARRAEMRKAAQALGYEVEIVAFTGMSLGKFPVAAESADTITVTSKTGVKLIFDKATGLQTNAKNIKFANRIKK